ncbi:MAG: ABC transporter permease [Acidimicrobiales bacterium]
MSIVASARGPLGPLGPGDAPIPEGGAAGGAGGHRTIWRSFVETFVENRLGLVGLGIILFMVLFSFVGPVFWKTNQVTTNFADANLAPSWAHPIGTDPAGYDVLGRLMLGGQSSLELGLAVAAMATLLGASWGAISGFVGGILDAVMMRIVDALLSIPTLVLLLILAAIFTPSQGLLIVILGALSWLVTARLVRGEALSLRGREYVEAVRLAGSTRRRIIYRHIIPNALGVIVVQSAFEVADAILAVAYLSFLGLGIPPPHASWGGILAHGLNYMYDGYWWLVYPAGIGIVLTVVGFYCVGNALRDSLDSRLRRR